MPDSWKPCHQAVTLPALPTGIARASGRLAQLLDHLEGGRLLALDPVRVDRVDELDRVLVGELADDRQRLVEVALQGDHAGAVHQRLDELADRDLALGDDDGAAHAGLGGVGGGAGGRVAGRGADHGLGAGALGARDGDRHPAVLEGARGVGPLELEEDVRADPLGELLGPDQRGRALVQGHDRVSILERELVAVALDQPGGHATRRTPPRSPGSRAACARSAFSLAIRFSAGGSSARRRGA